MRVTEGRRIVSSGQTILAYFDLACLLACFPRHYIANVADHFMYQQSPLLPVSLVNRERSATVLFDQSLMSSVHLRLGLPRLIFDVSRHAPCAASAIC